MFNYSRSLNGKHGDHRAGHVQHEANPSKDGFPYGSNISQPNIGYGSPTSHLRHDGEDVDEVIKNMIFYVL